MPNPPNPPPHVNSIVPALKLPNIAFIEARWYRRGRPRRARAIWLVLHATHGAEHARAAEDCARDFQTRPAERKGSAHLVIDPNSVVQCVPFENEAFHCGAFGNQYGEGIELCGRADQTREQWLDENSRNMLGLAAHVLRWRSDALFVPLIYRGPAELVQRIPGVTTHADITKAFPGSTDHWDPGPAFPLAELLEAARSLPPTPVPFPNTAPGR